MATEADIAEAISHKKREVEAVTYLTAAVQLETTKDIINSTFGTSVGGNFLEPFSAPKVANENVSSLEHYQADEPFQSEKEKSENEKQLGKGEQLETLEETRREGNGQTEEKITTAEQDNKSHGSLEVIESSQEMANTGEPGFKIEGEETKENKLAVEQHIEVISNQQASIEESQPSIEKEIKGLEEDEKQEIVEDKSTSLSGKEVLNVDNTSSTDAEEIGEERSFTGVLNKEAEKSFDLVEEIEKDDKEKITDNSIANASIPNVAASQETQNDEEETSKSGDTETDKLEKASITGLSEQEAGIEEEEKHNEVPVTPGKVIIQDEIESNEQEKYGAPEILNIAKESTLDVTNQSDFDGKAALASVTSSGNINNEEISEQKFDASSIIHEEGIQQKDVGLDLTETAVEEVRDIEESTVVVAEDITTSKLIHAEDHKELESTEYYGRTEPSLLQQNEPENKKLELNAIAQQQEIAASKDDAITTTCVQEESNEPEITGKDFTAGQEDENDAGKLKEEESSTKITKEGNVNELPLEHIQEDSTATLKVGEDEGEKSKEEIVEESETVGTGERISCEASEHAERSVDVSLVKQEEVKEEEAEDLVPIKASIEENKVDTFFAELAKDDEHDIVEDTEKKVKVESKGEEDSEKALQKDEPEETPDTEKKEENTENLENTDSTRKEVLETSVAGKETEEQILEEFTNERPNEENSKEHKEFTALETAPSSTKTGEHNLEEQTISELSSSLAGEKTVEDSSKGDENNAIGSKEEKEDKNSEFKEQNVETDLTEKKEPEDSTEPNKDNYATTTTEHLEEEILAEESKETFVQISSVVSETNEKVIEEEIQDKGVTINNSDSVPDRTVSEEIGLKEAEPDNKDQVIHSDIALEEKELTSNVDSEVQQEQKSSTEESGKEVPAIASESVEQTEEEIEEKAPTLRIGNEEKIAIIERVSDDIPEENLQDSPIVPSIKNEVKTTETSHVSEETPEKDESVKPNDVPILESYDIVKETKIEEVQKQSDEELHISSEQINDINSSESEDVGTLKTEEATEFANKNEVPNLEILKDEKLSSEVYTSNAVDTCIDSEKAIQECKEPENKSEDSLKTEVNTAVELEANTNRNDELPTKEALETTSEGQETGETDSIKDYSPEFANEEQLEGSTNEDKVLETTVAGQETEEQILEEFTNERPTEVNSKEHKEFTALETAPLSTKTGDHNLDEQTISELSSSLAGEETVEDSSKGDKNNVIDSKEEKEDKNSEFKEQDVATDLTEEKEPEDSTEPNKDNYATTTTEHLEEEILAEESKETFAQNSSVVSESKEKVIEEEIQDKGVTINNSDSVPDRIVSEEIGLKEAKPDNKDQVIYSDIALEEKELRSNIDSEVQQEQKSSTEESGEEIPAIPSESVEPIEDKSPTPRIENEEKRANETILDDVPEDSLQDSSTVPSINNEALTTEASDISEETSARDETHQDSAKTPSVKPTDEELQLINEDESVKPYDVSKLETYDIVKETENEEVQKQMDQELHISSEQINDTNSSESGEVGTLKTEEATDFAYRNEVSSLEILKDEKLSSEVSTRNAVDTCIESEEAIQEYKEPENNSEGSLKSEVNKAIELEANTNKNDELPTKKASETTNEGQETRETDSIKDYSPEFANEEQLEGSTNDDKVIVGVDTTPASTTIGKQDLEERDISEISSSLLQEETVKEILKDDKNAVTNLEEERKVTDLDSKEQLEVTDLRGETKHETLEENIETNKGLYATRTEEAPEKETYAEEGNKVLSQDSSFVSDVSEKVIEEESEEKEPAVYNSKSVSDGLVSDESELKGELEDKEQVKCFTIEPEEKGSASSATFDVKPEESSSSEVIREEILTAATDHGDKIEDKVEESINTRTEEEEKILTNETSAGTVSDESGLMKGEQEDEEQVKSFTIAPEESGSASNATYDVKPEENSSKEEKREQILKGANENGEKIEDKVEESIDTQTEEEEKITSNETSAGTLGEETTLKHGEPEDEEQVKSYTIAPEDGEKIEDKVEESIHTQTEEEEKITSNETPAGNVSEETGLKKGEPEDEEQVKSYTIAPEEKDSASSATFDLKPEENSSIEEKREEILTGANDHGEKIEDKVEESIGTQTEEEEKITSNETSAGTVSEETVLKHGEPEDEEQVKSYTIAPEEKDSASRAAFDVKPEENSGTEENREEILTASNGHGEKIEAKVQETIDTQIEEEEKITSNEMSTGTVSEETWLKKGELEDEGQVKSYTIAPDDSASSATFDDGEKIEEKVEENIDTGTEEEKNITTNETSSHDIPGDDHLTSEAIERSEKVTNLAEETKLEILEDSAGPNKESYATITTEALEGEKLSEESNNTFVQNSSSVVEVSEKVIEDVIQDKAPIISNSSSDSTGIPIEETGSKEAEPEVRNSDIEPKEKDLASSAGIEIKQRENSNTEENGDKEISAIAKSGEKIGHALEETREKDSVEDYPTESSTKEQPEENTKEDKVLVGIETIPLSTNLGKLELGEQEISETSSSLAGGEKAEEILKDEKNALMNLKEERKGTELDSKEQLDLTLDKDHDTTRTIEATKAETHAEERSIILVQDSSFVSKITEPEKEIEEEIKEMEPTVYNSNSGSAGPVSEEIDLKKGEPEERDQVKSYTIEPEEKGSAAEDSSSTKENVEEILTAANDHGEKIEDKVEESIDSQTEEKKITTIETSSRDITEADLLTTEAVERLDETPAGYKVTDLTEETKHDTLDDSAGSNKELNATITTEALEEEEIAEESNKTLVQNSTIVAEASEKVIEEKIQDKETVSTGIVIEETDLKEAEPENKEHIQNSDIAPEEKVLASNVDIEIPQEKNCILEEDGEEEIPVVAGESEEKKGHADKNFEASISDTEVVKTATELKAENTETDEIQNEAIPVVASESGEEEIPVVAGESGEKKGHADKNFEANISDAEVVKPATELKAENTENNEIQREENLESVYPGQMLAYTSESATQDEIEETLSLTKDIHTEPVPIEQQEVAQNFHGESEIKVETEPRLIVEDQSSEKESTSETIKAVILTEVTEEIEKADKSENIEEHVIDRESNLKEFHPVSIGEEKESGLIFGENLKEPDSNETTPPSDSQTEEDTSKKGESSVTEAPHKEKIEDEGITEPKDVYVAVAEEGKYEEEIKGDSATVTEATAVTNLADAQLLEKSSSNLVSQHLNLDHRDTERENATVENSDEVQETKKALDIEDTDETRPIPTVEKLETGEIEEEIKESSKIVSTTEIVNDQAISAGISEEQLQVQSSTFFAEEQEHETKTAIKELEKESSKEVDKQGDDNIDDSSATQKEEHKELKVSELDVEKQFTKETEEDIKNAPDKKSTKEVEKQDNENIEDSSATNLQKEEHNELKVSELDVEKLVTNETGEDIKNAPKKESTNEAEKKDNESIEDSSAAHLQQEEQKEPKVSELAVEKLVTKEIEEDIKNAPQKEGTKEVEKQDNESIEDSSSTHSQQEEHKELKVSELAVEKLGTNETEEDLENAPETVSKSHSQSIEAISKDEIITDQILPPETTSTEQFQVSSFTFLPKEQEQGTPPAFKAIDVENKEEVETLDNESSKVFDTTKTSEEAFTHKEEPKELKVSEGVAEISGPDKAEEEIKEASETVPKSNSEEFEEVTKEKIITDQTLPEEISKGQLLVSSSTLLPREQEDETATTTQKIEEENKKEVEILGNENIVDNSSPKTAEEDISLEKEEPRELKVSEPTVQTLGEDEIEEKVKESETMSEHSFSNIEVLAGDKDIAHQVLPVDKDEIIIDQALPAGLSPEQLQLPVSTLLPKELEHDSATTVEKTEEEIRAFGSPLQSEKTTDIIGEITETTNLNIGSSEIPSNFVSEKAQNDGLFTKTEDIEVDKSHLEVPKTDLRTEESQSELTTEANNTIKNEILNEEIKEDKEATNDSQPVSLGEENVQESHQEIDSKTKEHPGDKTDGTFKAATNENQHKELSEADEEEGTNGYTKKLIIISEEATSAKDHESLSIEDRTIEENSPAEAEEKNVEDEALNLDTENQRDEAKLENRTTEFTSTREKETTEIPREESGMGLTEAEKTTSDIKQLEISSHATLEKQTPREEDLDESSTATRSITAEKEVPVPPTVPDPVEETTHRTEPKQTEPRNDTSVNTEIKVVERGIEEEKGESGGRTTETASSAGKLSLSELMQSSTEETKQQVIEEREAKSSKEAEAEVEYEGEAEKDDEGGEEHKGSSEPESDAPVIVEASRDIDVKVAPKKSHNILSGVGSKVKHSISKVKKAITGKSSHSKQSTKKLDDPSS